MIQFHAISKVVWYNKASDEQKQAASENQDFTNQLKSQFNTEFGQSQAIQGALNSQLQTITNNGLAGKGYLGGEEAGLRTDADERAAQQDAQAQQASGQTIAAKSEGGALTSGAVAQGVEENATDAAANNAAAQRGITERNADLARQNVSQGLSGLSNLSGQEANEADSLAGTASSNAANSYNEVTQAYQPSNFWGNLASGLAGGVVNAFAPGVGSLISGGLSKAFNGSPNTYLQPSTPQVTSEIPEEEEDDPFAGGEGL